MRNKEDKNKIKKEAYKAGVEEYMMTAHSAILAELSTLMPDLNEKEINSHDKVDEWLCAWKGEAVSRIWNALKKAKREQLKENKE